MNLSLQLCDDPPANVTEQRLRSNIGFVRREAERFARFFVVDADDLIQEGFMGIMEADARFNADKGANFLTYAAYYIRNRMRRFSSRTFSLTQWKHCLTAAQRSRRAVASSLSKT